MICQIYAGKVDGEFSVVEGPGVGSFARLLMISSLTILQIVEMCLQTNFCSCLISL